MDVIVCGGRDYANKSMVGSVLTSIEDNPMVGGVHVVTGECSTGADAFAKEWATSRAHRRGYTGYPANWRKHGPAAGPIRNSQMLEECKPDLVVAFPGGKGTEDMISKARSAGVTVLLVGKSYPLLW